MRELVQMPFFNNLSGLVWVLFYFTVKWEIWLWFDTWLAKIQNVKYLQKQNPLSKTVEGLWNILLLRFLYWSISDMKLVGKLDFAKNCKMLLILDEVRLLRKGYFDMIYIQAWKSF